MNFQIKILTRKEGYSSEQVRDFIISKIPEGVEVGRDTDKIVKRSCVNGKWMYFTNVFKIGSSFQNVDIRALIPALDQPIVDIFCKGKEYFFMLANHITIRAHRGMAGYWTVDPDPNLRNTHFRLDFSESLTNNPDINGFYHPTISFYFVNTQFGQFEILTTEHELITAVNKLASGFIGRFILTKEEWTYTLSNISKTKTLRTVLMDQKELCSGVGNYLFSELMYHAKLNPYIYVGDLFQISQKPETYGQPVNLVGYLYDVCLFVINGHYRKTLEKVVYTKDVSPNGHKIIGEKRNTKGEIVKTKGTRTTWYCPAEQFHPRQIC